MFQLWPMFRLVPDTLNGAKRPETVLFRNKGGTLWKSDFTGAPSECSLFEALLGSDASGLLDVKSCSASCCL
ncbi:unnamed protein product [Lampetra planeri]